MSRSEPVKKSLEIHDKNAIYSSCSFWAEAIISKVYDFFAVPFLKRAFFDGRSAFG
jgi:hypothetical protein